MQAAAEAAAPVTMNPALFWLVEPVGGDAPVVFVDPPSAPAGAVAGGGIGGAPAGADGVVDGGEELGGADGGDKAAGAELGVVAGAEAEAGGGAKVGLGALGAGAGGDAVAGGGLEADGAGDAAGGGVEVLDAGGGAAGEEGGAPPLELPLRPARTMTMSFSLARQLASTPLMKKKAPARSRVKTVLPSAIFLSYDDVLQAL
jgi:hypothetical protein